jgi:hypothetical protein
MTARAWSERCRTALVATHMSFRSVCHVAVDGDVFRWGTGPWDY